MTAVRALARQEFPGQLEVIVVVDGSTDGSAAALRDLKVPVALTVIEQPNRGASAARNRGAAAARGEILLFLDDDMEADSKLLAELDRSHRDGADVVFGHLPLHPASPVNFLSVAVEQWAMERLDRLTTSGEGLTLHDLLTGQMSLSRTLFFRVGGFDTSFTHNGSFGNEDIDFGYRLMRGGYRLVFNPNAISFQNYIVQPRQFLNQWRQTGQADVAFARKHPEAGPTIFALNRVEKPLNRLLWHPLVALSPLSVPLMNALRWLALKGVTGTKCIRWAIKFYYQIQSMEYCRGIWEAGGVPRARAVRVLAYHAIRDLNGAPVIGPYCVPPDLFRRQLDLLRWAGFHFVSPDEFIQFLHHGGSVPRRAVFLTFDDGYEELADVVLPTLQERGIPAAVFAVSKLLGGTNEWDEVVGAPRIRLLDGAGLRELAAAGLETGAHSRDHRPLSRLPNECLVEQIAGSVAELEAAHLQRPRMFAYPEGDYDQRVKDGVRAAGLEAAFTVCAGLIRPGHDPYELPRIEILRTDSGWKFLWKVIRAGRWKLHRPFIRS